ncbi:MAG TPA: hypothetical protein VFE06_01585 [Acidobacteriaceae bacterium]|jgi:hypothetical protein|nr:hypothetical protein [Acidobacteriaceae bacterium]
MAQNPDDQHSSSPEPRGFGEHTRKTSSENAHEQGWGLNEDQRRHIPPDQQRRGGTDYDYGAQDFGDLPVDTSTAQPPAGKRPRPAQSESQNVSGEADRKRSTRQKTA